MANKNFNKRVQKAVNRRVRRMENKDLLDPKKTISGKQLRRVANSLTNIELNPTIGAYKRQAQQIGRQNRRDSQGLRRLGNQSSKQIGGVYDALEGAGAQNIAAQQATAANLNQGTADVNAAASAEQRANTTGVLGDLTSSLEANGADVGGSAARQAMAARIQEEQMRNSQLASGSANLANVVGASGVQAAQGQQMASQAQGTQSQAAVKAQIASRIAAEKGAARDAQREAYGKVADTRALKGASRLKNIMDLRTSERTYGNERAAIGIDKGTLNETKRSNKADESLTAAEIARKTKDDRRDARNDRLDNKADGPADTPGKMTRPEWRQWSAAAQNLIEQEGRVPKNWQAFADELAKQEGVSWTPQERRQFIQRIKRRQ